MKLTDTNNICSTCGHDVTEDGVGFTFSNGKIQYCGRCQDLTRTPVGTVILNVEEEQLEFDWSKK